MYLLEHYFNAVTTGQKSSQNGSVLSQFFTPPPPPTTATTARMIDAKKISDDLGKAIVEVFKSFEQKNDVKFRFTKKVGSPR